ncbi:hypothetical protein [Streptomyces sp. NPDC056291]|uniref:hypothetical protein n=1 Tax=Streptomyces sp. NPDC056291 TaxID=3345772 RepID=UPI0035DCA018
MDAATSSAIFTAAATATSWKKLNTGLTTTVSHGGYVWTVQLPPSEEGAKAEIIACSGYGGTEFMTVQATWGQTFEIVEAAMAATRLA